MKVNLSFFYQPLANVGIPGEQEKWNYGRKASHYIDATEKPWSDHYKMFSYLSKELPDIINKNFPVLPDKQSIIGHRLVLLSEKITSTNL